MVIENTGFDQLFVIRREKLTDDRGYFARTWCQKELEGAGLNGSFVQGNVSYNYKAGTLRGMHYQVYPAAEDKLVSCIAGEIFDVVVNIDPESPNFGKSYSRVLTAVSGEALFIGKHYAHGFQTLTDNAVVSYQMTEFYTPGTSGGFYYGDPKISIEWPMDVTVISEKDLELPTFMERRV